MSASIKLRETTLKLINLTAALAKFQGFQMSSSILSLVVLNYYLVYAVRVIVYMVIVEFRFVTPKYRINLKYKVTSNQDVM